MPADRLRELLHQRAVLQEQLASLDREIAAALERTDTADSPSPPGAPAPSRPVETSAPSPIAVPAPTPPSPAPLAPEVILDEYRVSPDTLRTDVRKGCLLYFFAAFAALFFGIAALYFALRRN